MHACIRASNPSTLAHNYIGHNYIGHNYMGHDYVGHNYICHNHARAYHGDQMPKPSARKSHVRRVVVVEHMPLVQRVPRGHAFL